MKKISNLTNLTNVFTSSVSQPGPKSSKKRSQAQPETGSPVKTDTGSPPAKKDSPTEKVHTLFIFTIRTY